MFKLLTILACFFSMFQPLKAKVDPPNYDFGLDTLDDFYPGKKNEDLEKKYSKPEIMEQKSGQQTLKYYVTHIRYKFPVLVQVKDGVVLDSFARLPSYFMHDAFFQSLITRMGKQKTYKKAGEEAVYTWEKDSFKHVYSASCTITCFPIFYSIQSLDPQNGSEALIDQMKKAVPKF